MIYDCLKMSIDFLTRKAIRDFERDFVEISLAMCYIRVPEFREALLKCLESCKKVKIKEWNTLKYKYDEKLKPAGFV